MKTTTIRDAWYEVWAKGGGCKLADPTDRFRSHREAQKAIKESREKASSLGYAPTDWQIMIVDWIAIRDDDGIISQTETIARA